MGNDSQRAEIRRAVDEVNAAMERFTRSQDGNGMASLYTEDATFITLTGEVLRGRAAIAEHWRQSIAGGLRDVELRTLSVEPVGTRHACEIATYRVRLEGPQGESVTQEGPYVVLWKRAPDGRWKMYVDAPFAD